MRCLGINDTELLSIFITIYSIIISGLVVQLFSWLVVFVG